MSDSPAGNAASPERSIGLMGATAVGIGAIVGGGILVLAGVAFRATGPAAMLAFALNGVIAIITAMSFAEMSTAFPESGGAYTFAKKVLNVRAAFAVGWVLWFAYIVAGVLYALGFASYAVVLLQHLWALFGKPPEWLSGRSMSVALALGPTILYTLSLIRKSGGGGDFATWGKVVVFTILILAGCWAIGTSPQGTIKRGMSPFFTGGFSGLLQALGFTLIALQGFDLIAAIAGEVKSPSRVIPRAMLISLGVGLAIYIPLLFLAATVGADPGSDIVAMSNANPETVMANAARNFMGVTGYWLVIIAAVLSTLSALGANLLAASRVALSMANDRTLPKVIGQLHESRRTPVMAIYTSALTLIAIVLIVPDLASAGAAASLIFLIVFALAHWMSILARKRTEQRMSMLPPSSPFATAELLNTEKPFRSPWFPVLPVVGGLACAGMALFQGIAVPAAGAVAVLWLALGVLLYMALFSGRAETFDALAEAHDPALAKLRGRSPLVLVPLANPKSAPMLVAMAGALAPPRYGRVTLLSVMRPPDPDAPEPAPADNGLNPAHAVLRDALRESLKAGHRPEALITIASTPWREIRRVARTYQCAGLLLGLGHQRTENTTHLEELLEAVSCDVAFLRAPDGWSLDQAKRILVPVGGRGAQAELRARLLGSLERGVERDFIWFTTQPESADEDALKDARRKLHRLAEDATTRPPEVIVERHGSPVDAIIEQAEACDLVVLGLQRGRGGTRSFSEVALRVAYESPCAVVLISQGERN
ncbi:MAG: amino acid permease [Polyangiaceae bacterium]|nr:amino acid permease [Polyangiaceae bacterium]MCB9607354.1 amino acid permease [Polyangiaceae bacterium]